MKNIFLDMQWPNTFERYARDMPGDTEVGVGMFTVAKRAYNESMLDYIPTPHDLISHSMNTIEHNLTHRPIKRRSSKKLLSEEISWETNVS